MIAARIEGFTRELAKEQDEYRRLCIKDEVIDGVPYMTSCWEPTPQQLATLNAGGKIYLSIAGQMHPPVSLWVEAAPESKND